MALREPLTQADPEAVLSVRRLARALSEIGSYSELLPVLTRAAELAEAADSDLPEAVAELLSVMNAAIAALAAGPIHILVADGDRARRSSLVEKLSRPDRRILTAATAREALTVVERYHIALLLVTLNLPDLDGRDLLLELRRAPETYTTPILVLGLTSDEAVREECVALGADAYIPPEWDAAAIESLIGARLARRDERAARADRDALTGALNRSAFYATGVKALSESAAAEEPSSLALVALDHLHEIHDTFGWDAGNEVLQHTSRFLSEASNGSHIVGRLGGTGFGILLPHAARTEAVELLSNVLERVRAHPFRAPEGERFHVTFTASVVEIEPSETLESALARAGRIARSPYADRGNTILTDGSLHEESDPTILLAEDNELISSVIIHRLEREGFQVVLCTDGHAALQRALAGPVDLIITNVNLGGIDGFALVERLRNIPPSDRTPVLFLTSRGRQEDLVRGFELGADDYMVKPFSPNELVARVHRLLRIRA